RGRHARSKGTGSSCRCRRRAPGSPRACGPDAGSPGAARPPPTRLRPRAVRSDGGCWRASCGSEERVSIARGRGEPRLAARVGIATAARARLNALVHPLIAAEVGRRIAAARAEGFDGPLVVEAAVLLEAGWRPLVDRVWAVSTRREHAVARILAARDLRREEVERRL